MDEKSRIRFRAKAIAVAREELDVSCEGEEARAFLNSIHEDYISEGSPQNIHQWLVARLSPEFRCVSDRPVWVEDEPEWPFFADRPMVFIEQISLPKNEVTTDFLTWSEVVYLFGARSYRGDGYEIVYREIVQHPGIDGTGER